MIIGGGNEWHSLHGRAVHGAKYMEHVRELLRHLRTDETGEDDQSVQLPPESYIGNGTSDGFWELIGFRIWGHPHLLLGAARFSRHEGSMVEYGRESLPYYLTSPEDDGADAGVGHRSLEVRFPGPDEPVPLFLEALRAREERPIVQVDPGRVQFAFDFRTVNPSSVSKIRPDHAHPRPTAFRTTEGHILIGATKNLAERLHDPSKFLVLLNPVQRTPHGTHVLPTLTLHRSFVAAAAEAPDVEDDRSLERLLPFDAGTALSSPLLL